MKKGPQECVKYDTNGNETSHKYVKCLILGENLYLQHSRT